MTDDELREAIVTMFSGGVVNKAAIETLQARGLIRDVTEASDEKRRWRVTDEGKKFAGLDA